MQQRFNVKKYTVHDVSDRKNKNVTKKICRKCVIDPQLKDAFMSRKKEPCANVRKVYEYTYSETDIALTRGVDKT